MKNETKIKAYTPKEIADFYGISVKTLRTWLQPHSDAIGDRVGRYYSLLQVKMIFERLGEP